MTQPEQFVPDRYDLDDLDLADYDLRGFSEIQVALTHRVTGQIVLRDVKRRNHGQHRDNAHAHR